MKLLSLDIETTPNLAHVWGLWQQNVGLPQLLEATEMLCFVAKWYGEPDSTEFHSLQGGKAEMVRAAHRLLSAADVVMHFNGRTFDVPHLNREFVEQGLTPPAPFRQIDLLQAVKKTFKLPSNKLMYVTKWLNLDDQKIQTSGHSLWIRCMAGDPAAWEEMERYNRRDVEVLEAVYDKLRPWIPNHPNVGLFDGVEDACPACGSKDLKKEGWAYLASSRFQRFSCRGCGKWSRSNKRDLGTSIAAVSL